MGDYQVILSCEHGGNAIPKPYRHLFAAQGDLLATHRGFDPGALEYAHQMAAHLNAPLLTAATSRLLVDLNRTPGRAGLFSRITRALAAADRQQLVARYHTPHRVRVRAAVQAAYDSGATAVHIACHSFTPVLDGRVRTMDVGLLYDPQRRIERRFCDAWKSALQIAQPACRIRRNAPYKGTSDGLPSALRRVFAQRYVGIELELNQRFFFEDKARWRQLCDAVVHSLAATLASHDFSR